MVANMKRLDTPTSRRKIPCKVPDLPDLDDDTDPVEVIEFPCMTPAPSGSGHNGDTPQATTIPSKRPASESDDEETPRVKFKVEDDLETAVRTDY